MRSLQLLLLHNNKMGNNNKANADVWVSNAVRVRHNKDSDSNKDKMDKPKDVSDNSHDYHSDSSMAHRKMDNRPHNSVTASVDSVVSIEDSTDLEDLEVSVTVSINNRDVAHNHHKTKMMKSMVSNKIKYKQLKAAESHVKL